MSPGDLARLALGAVRAHRVRTTLAVSGTAVGVASVILLISLGEGAREYVRREFLSIGSNLLVVLPGKTETTGGPPMLFGGTVRKLTLDDALAVLRRSPRTRRVAPVSMGQASVKHLARGRLVTVVGSTRDLLEIRGLAVAAGQFLPQTDPRRGGRICIVGRTVQRELFGGENPLGKNLRIGEWRFRIIGVLGRKGTSLGMDMDDVVIVPVPTAMELLNRDGLFEILVEVNAFQEVGRAQEEVKAILTERHGEEDFTIMTQGAVASAFGDILAALGLALGGIAAVSLSVAGIGVMNVMLVSVSERTGEIGLWKAVGARRSQIVVAFLAEALVISSIGSLVGTLLGLLGAQALAKLIPGFPAITPLWAVMAAVGVATGVGTTFGVLPARRAAAVTAVEALQKGR